MTSYKIPRFRAKLVRDGAFVHCQSPLVAVETLRAVCCERGDRETFAVLYLDGCCNVIGVEVVAIGGTSGCLIEPKLVFRGAVIAGASAVILGHNHPSRDYTPSAEDVSVTKSLSEAGSVLGIKVVDHIIVTDDASYSFADRGLI